MKVFAITTLAVLVSCTGAREASPPPGSSDGTSPATIPTPLEPVTDYASFVSRLESDGHTVRRADGRTSWLHRAFGVRGQLISIDGAKVYTFEYPTIVAADKLRSSVSDDGHTIEFRRGAILIEWVSHFHGSGRLIVVFVGSRQRTIRTLDQLLGPQFAGA